MFEAGGTMQAVVGANIAKYCDLKVGDTIHTLLPKRDPKLSPAGFSFGFLLFNLPPTECVNVYILRKKLTNLLCKLPNRLVRLSNIKLKEISDTVPHTFFYLYMCVVNGTTVQIQTNK